MSNPEEALQAKARGNKFFAAKQWDEAIKEYSQAIEHDPDGKVSHTFFSNRSACYAEKDEYDRALADADKCIQLKEDWAKGYSRKGLAHFKLGEFAQAQEAYEQGLTKDPENATLKQGLEETKKAKARPPRGGGLFGPEIWQKIHADPELREFTKDPQFVNKVNMLQNNFQMAMQMGLLQDPQIMKLFEKAMGLKFPAMPKKGGGGPTADDDGGGDTDDDLDFDLPGENENPFSKKPKPAPKKAKTPTPEPEETKEEKEERLEKEKNEKDALEAKERGNKLFKEKKCEEAIREYEKAASLDGTKPAYLLNKSAVLYSLEKWDECIKACEQALEICRKNFSDLQWSFKAYHRLGGVEEKRKDFPKAIHYYKKALLERKDSKLKKRVQSLESFLKKDEEKKYVDPEKASDHKEKGNEHFKAGKWKEAITEYSESIKRNPKDARVFSNRATSYCKLMAWQPALQDCDAAIKLDKKFIKPYIRKGKIQHALGQYHKALECYAQAADIDPNVDDLRNAKQDTMIAIQKRNASGKMDEAARQRALADPDVKAAMNDPEVSSVLLQAQSDPSILMKAMRERPHIARKVEYLMAAGVLQMR